ncbi:MAG: molybdopterin molybdotransferase MoeA [Bacteriovoracaceae bacterium]|nr:molybdopterin molybdotransferase MoeA [Bacteriovoracaceae bacterium]
MITSYQAQTTVLSYQLQPRVVTIPLEDSLSRILAEDVVADIDQPPFHRVAMDGIAVKKEQLLSSRNFQILGTVSAGSAVATLPPGNVCFEIMTGAVLPINADFVIRYEDLKISHVAEVCCDLEKLSANFHPQGNDYRKGDKVLSLGTQIKSTTTAILASVGKSEVKVFDLPRVAILSTGDELVDIGVLPGPHQIRWSNGVSLKQQLAAFNYNEVTLHKVGDDEAAMKKMMMELLQTKDVLLLTGGVSAGKFDFVPKLLKECQVDEIFHKVAQRPGKPLWFGKTASNVFVFGLPGNPVSCLVNLRKFVIPFLGGSYPGYRAPMQKAFLAQEVKFNKSLTYYCPIKLSNIEGKLMATPLAGNGSGDFYQLRDSDGFIELRPEEGPFKKDLLAEIYLWERNNE